jgi:hypothetical protein
MQQRRLIPIDSFKEKFIFIDGNFYKKNNTNIKTGWTAKDGRKYIFHNGYAYLAHRVAWAFYYGQPDQDVDHIDGDPTNNRIENLRSVKHKENQQNIRKARKDNISGLLGVAIHRQTGKYTAQIWKDNKKKHLGIFETAEEAHQIYLEAKRKMHSTCTI